MKKILGVCALLLSTSVLASKVTSASMQSVKIGGQINIVLKANATTGYSWELVKKSPLLTLKKLTYKPRALCQPGMMGCSGEAVFTLHAIKAGTAYLTFVYKRPWEKEIAERKSIRVRVVEGKKTDFTH